MLNKVEHNKQFWKKLERNKIDRQQVKGINKQELSL